MRRIKNEEKQSVKVEQDKLREEKEEKKNLEEEGYEVENKRMNLKRGQEGEQR